MNFNLKSTEHLGNLSQLWAGLIVFHVVVIAASNYLVQIPFTLLGFQTNIGTFTFPIIFLLSDLAVRIFGAKAARRIVFLALFPALVFSYLISVLFINGSFTSLESLLIWDGFVGRIVLASFLAYLIGQLLDIRVFNQLRKHRYWLLAPLLSTTLGSLIDTFSFYAIAFYRSPDEFMSANWFDMAVFDYGFKMLISILVFIPIYRIIIGRLAHFLSR